ncbi:unnamed protein product [Rotaria socialis]|uniref:DDE-1 domain-containing protein n=1 Tax=Rotaria socialis TaxID=392032 RepID=A0A817UHT7_9BILA|nr:unnamed protein product [Rotaria socialis]CAF3358024.1 unnamed protein product [Rotaria socialis]CAF3390851.1 unnamed protein product [Rotaria socialis]CAF4570613.1 unnamed protein product [Rotaria socialis]CAF4850053.1 unnamed protein product [Rotaria socialis]
MKYPVQKLIDAINSDLSSVVASNEFNVPERTIRAHRQKPDQKIGGGRPRYLNDEQEDYLVSLFKLLPEFGFTITANVALKLSNEYFKSIGLSFVPRRKWLKLFIKRHRTEVKWKKEEKMEKIRAQKFTEQTRKSWFSLLKSTLIKLDLMDKPAQIFNCDETGFSDKTKRQHVIVTSTTRHVFEKDGGGGKHHTTALIAINAAGQVISPFIVYAGKTLMNVWCKGGPDGSRYAGWIDSCSFEYWLKEMFIPATAHLNRPVLLIMDGHNAHVNLNIINLMKQHNIACLILPPHCTHSLQPIDVVLFNNVKIDWCDIVKNYFKSGHKSIRNADIPRLMKRLFIEKQSFSTTRIVSSFSRSGIWPFNEHAMVDKVVTPAFSSLSTSTINQTAPSPTNILIPPSHSSVVHSSCTTSLSSELSITSNIESTVETLSSDIMSVDDTSTKQQQQQHILTDIQRIRPIEPIFIDDREIPSFTGSTYTVLNTIDLNISMLETQSKFEPQPIINLINQPVSMLLKEQNEQKKKKNQVVQTIDAVREVLVGLLDDQKQQYQMTTATATTSRASRLNNTTGVNITDEDFVKMMQEKASSKTKQTGRKNKKKKLNTKPKRPTKRKKNKIIGIDSEQENDDDMDYESNVRRQLDLAITETQLIVDDQQTTIL